MSRIILEDIIVDFSPDKFVRFFREKSTKFASRQENVSQYNDEHFKDGIKLGEITFAESEQLAVFAFQASQPLSERSGKKAQYEKGKKLLKDRQYDAGIFIFYDKKGSFRFSLIYANYLGKRRDWSVFRRFTYFVSNDEKITNKTFLKQIGEKDFSTLNHIKEAFSLSAVTDIFYKEFFVEYNKTVESVKIANNIKDQEKGRDFVLLFVIRTVFLGFIQKKGWIGDDDKFIQNIFKEYEKGFFGKDEFYRRWLRPLFFEALNSPPGKKVADGNNDFSEETEAKLQMAPYLNGGLFREKDDYDNNDWYIPDQEIKNFFDFLFSHSFTIEENSLEDEDLQLNPEFLGIIFERLVNKADGAVYTPRTEVDLMCRLSLVKWLQKNLASSISGKNLYELFFYEGNTEQDQKDGSFSGAEINEILLLLESLAICDLAVGSGAFLVGMAQVLDDVEQKLKEKIGLKNINIFERKKSIIAKSLYGVEVKEWAVWICQLRLWLSLFIEAPDDLKGSLEPILPSLDFKIRQGDSLVQRVGTKLFPVTGHIQIQSKAIKDKITKLKKFKIDYFENKTPFIKGYDAPRQAELKIYSDILDNEIKEKEEEIRKIGNRKKHESASLFGDDKIENEQGGLFEAENKKLIDKLQTEIAELKEQKNVLRKDKPLIWSIEFAEIFAEKDGFDIIIGNPPYVRQEDIADPTGKIKDKKEYKDLLQEMVKLDFPDDFPPKIKINAQSDLYTYFYIRGLRLLNPRGLHTFICSNSWLDVGYGVWLQKFLLERASVELIIDNHAKRSFEAADVNTIISIIHAPIAERRRKVDDNHLVKFVAFKKPFDEAIYTDNLLGIENAKAVLTNEIFRVYPIINRDLKEAGTEYENETHKKMSLGNYVGDKWGGKYLRAPDIFFTILEKGKDKLVKLGDIAKIRRGFTTGINEFFYLTDAQSQEWKIEPEFLMPVIKSPRECKSILVNPKDLKYKIFICNKSKKELKGTNALKYIEWGEKQKTKKDNKKDEVYWMKVPSVKGRKYWYGLGERKSTKFNFNYLIDQVGSTYVEDVYVSDNFHEIHTSQNNIDCFMNSTLFYLFQNLTGRIGFGGGLLKIQTYELQRLLVLPNLQKVKPLHRDIEDLFKECGIDPKSRTPIENQEPNPLPDRADLDKVVFDALELSDKERKEVYHAVCRLVWNRISKANSV